MNIRRQKEKDWILREKYNGLATTSFEADLKRLASGEPVAYIIGFVDFLGCKIDLSEKPLIPRPETEYWTEHVIAEINKRNTIMTTVTKVLLPVNCLDIFSGSGCVGLAILKNVPNSKVVFVEKSTRFCRQIEKNLELNGIAKERYQIVRANIFRPIGGETFTIDKFDYILANPPYIPLERKDKLDKSVIDWEPDEALFTKDDGLLIIKRFLSEVKEHLNQDGQIWLEFDISQNLKIKGLLTKGGFTDIVFRKDQYSRWRFVTFKI